MAFQEYPKLMVHPQHAPAVIEPGKGTGLFVSDPVCLSYEKFPNITVHTKDQEQKYAARGYRPNNMADSNEYDQAVLEAAPQGGYRFQEYPKWKYHAYNLPCVVNSAQEEAALGGGWSNHPVLATEDDLETEPEAESQSTAVEHVAAAPARTKAKPKAKAPAKVPKRSKTARVAHASA